MKERTEQQKKRFRHMGVAVAVLTCVAVLSISARAWLGYQKRVAAIAEIDTPISIYISAAHQEDLVYLDLAGIDFAKGETDENVTGYKYKDYVFAVAGENIQHIQLQLAYTTNNQLRFSIYEATEGNNTSGVPYEIQTGNNRGETVYYAKGNEIPMKDLNKLEDADEDLANPNDSDTIGTYPTGRVDARAQKYALPLYWQSYKYRNDNGTYIVDETEAGHHIPTKTIVNSRFCNYFILRVWWPASRENDRETDILYIAARAR